MNKQWMLADNQRDEELINTLSKELKIDSILSTFLVDRGIKNTSEAKNFLQPSLDHLYDPFLMKDMDKAVKRVEQAIDKQEKVLVYGDYDVDGTTAVALMYNFLKKFLKEIDFYTPNRFSEGYGVSLKGINYAYKNKCSLIIALDCGIRAIKPINLARQKGIDFIVCDHHTPGKQLPEAIAVLDPKREDCNYPYKELTGCGVGFKLIQAIAKKKNIPFKKIVSYLDLVAVSIASDIVPILDENRVLATFGLKILEKNPRLGFRKLIDNAVMKPPISISDVVFKLGPRINAPGRVGSADDSIKLLITESEEEAIAVTHKIEELNEYRKNIDKKATQEAIKLVENSSLKNAKAIVLYQKDWNRGILGIIASRIVDRFYRPTIALSFYDGKISGSARSISDFDILDAIAQCEELLENYGGHKYAAGLTLTEQNLKAFASKFTALAEESLEDSLLVPKIKIDACISLKKITKSFNQSIEKLHPFGPKNMRPVFLTKDVVDYGFSKIVGKDREHLKLTITPHDSPACFRNGIAFSLGHYARQICQKSKFDICYTIQENSYMGKNEVQLYVRDIKIK